MSDSNLLLNVMINSIIKIFLNKKWFPLLNNSLRNVYCSLINLIMLKYECKKTTPSIFSGFLYQSKKYVRGLGVTKIKMQGNNIRQIIFSQVFQSTVYVRKSIHRSFLYFDVYKYLAT